MSISGSQKKDKGSGAKSGFRTSKKTSNKKNSKHHVLSIASQNTRDVFDTNKLPIGIIEEQNIDEEKGMVETQNNLVKKLPISEDNSTIVQNLIQKGNADISKNKNL